jgi:hypothetical protein
MHCDCLSISCDCLSISFLSSILCGIRSASTDQLSFINDINIYIWTSEDCISSAKRGGGVIWILIRVKNVSLWEWFVWFSYEMMILFCSRMGAILYVKLGRCHHTHGKKWRCSRGSQRSRKPVEGQKVTPTIAVPVIVVSGGVCHTTRPCLGNIRWKS